MKKYKDTLTFKEHKMQKHKKITQAELDKRTEDLNARIAEFSHPKTTEERKHELRGTSLDLEQGIHYDQQWLNNNCAVDEQGRKLLATGKVLGSDKVAYTIVVN